MKRVLVFGLGVTGLSCVRYFLKRGFFVFAMDKNPVKGLSITVFSEDHQFSQLPFDLIVVSPGISSTHKILQQARQEGVFITGEVAYALSQIPHNKIIAVTGTNGKSTVVSLIAHVLQKKGYRVCLAGNIGNPLIEVVENLAKDAVVVLELSSYQLETIEKPSFTTAVLLNVTPDHLERYASFQEYFLAKKKIGNLIKEDGQFFVGPSISINDIPHTAIQPQKISLPEKFFSLQEAVSCALSVLHSWNIDESFFLDALNSFTPLEHRLEFVANIGNIRCINDSKATNEASVVYALEKVSGKTALLCGGKNKNSQFNLWKKKFPLYDLQVIAFGEAAPFIQQQLKDNIFCIIVHSLEEAITKGLQLLGAHGNLLLSPGCASFDAFSSFAERGECFKQKVLYESKRYNLHCSLN